MTVQNKDDILTDPQYKINYQIKQLLKWEEKRK